MTFDVMYMDGDSTVVFEFPTQQEGMEWDQTVVAIKAHNRQIFQDGGRNRAELQRWVDSVMNMRTRWGNKLVPKDFRVACNSFERQLGLPPTNWED